MPADLGTPRKLTQGDAYVPLDNALIASVNDPCGSAGSAGVMTAGVIYLTKLWLPRSQTLAKLVVDITAAGTSLGSNQNWGGLYSSAGTLLAKTADQGTSWNSIGVKEMTLTVESGQTLTRGGEGHYVYGAILANGATKPSPRRADSGTAALINLGLASLAHRAGTSGTGQTTLPSSVASTTSAAFPYWMGLS